MNSLRLCFCACIASHLNLKVIRAIDRGISSANTMVKYVYVVASAAELAVVFLWGRTEQRCPETAKALHTVRSCQPAFIAFSSLLASHPFASLHIPVITVFSPRQVPVPAAHDRVGAHHLRHLLRAVRQPLHHCHVLRLPLGVCTGHHRPHAVAKKVSRRPTLLLLLLASQPATQPAQPPLPGGLRRGCPCCLGVCAHCPSSRVHPVARLCH